jgi:hypothetical protein
MAGRAPAGTRRLSAQELAAATPATRNRYADLLRVASIFVVVLGHWTMAVLSYHDGKFVGQNLLEIDPWTHILTWIFRVVPIFFIVGGFTNAFSWRSASERGVSYADWLRARSARLLGPALIFVAFWTFLPILAVALGIISSGMARTGGREVALPIWFLAVYLLTVAAAPPLLAAHTRFGGARVLVPLALAVAVVDRCGTGSMSRSLRSSTSRWSGSPSSSSGSCGGTARSRAAAGSRGPWQGSGSPSWPCSPCGSTIRSR